MSAMVVRPRAVRGMATAVTIIAVCGFAASAWLDRLNNRAVPLKQLPLPVVAGTASGQGDFERTPDGCARSTSNLGISRNPASPAELARLSRIADWQLISQRIRPGDTIFAYSRTPPAPFPDMAFTGVSGGYLVLRGRCLVGMLGTWIE
ncbi:MAG TPA: hypothetical protein VFR91_02980 [Dyella sp.]|nr:hypothetical protein [Dyella sp.]